MLVVSMLLFSCSMEKRYHSSGWHIQFGGGKSGAVADAAKPAKKAKPAARPVAEAEAAKPVIQEEVASVWEEPTAEQLAAEVPVESATVANPVQPEGKQVAEAKSYRVANREVAVANAKVKKAKESRSAVANEKAKPAGGDKSWIVAVLLCFFLGALGIHRFYLGYTWQGIVQLLTLGGFGIWVLIDFIRIIIRDLEPKDGSYSD